MGTCVHRQRLYAWRQHVEAVVGGDVEAGAEQSAHQACNAHTWRLLRSPK